MAKLLRPIRSAILFTCIAVVMSACGGNSTEGEFEYVAIGASDAVGIGATPLDEGYVFEIQDGLKSDGRDVGLLNLGIPGAESDEIRRLEVPVAIEEEPELITVFVGSNDIVAGVSLEDFSNDVSGMLSDLASKTDAIIAIATIPDLTQLPRFKDNPDQDVTRSRVDAFNAVIRIEANRSGALIAELANESIQAFQVSNDGFHPNDEGHQLIANTFLGVIRSVLPPIS